MKYQKTPRSKPEAHVGLTRYNGKVYELETRKELPIKEHNGNKYVNYAGTKISISKINDFDAFFYYIFHFGFQKKIQHHLENEAIIRMKR